MPRLQLRLDKPEVLLLRGAIHPGIAWRGHLPDLHMPTHLCGKLFAGQRDDLKIGVRLLGVSKRSGIYLTRLHACANP